MNFKTMKDEILTLIFTKIKSMLDTKSDTTHTHSYLPLSGGTMTGQIKKAGASTSWYTGRDVATIRMESVPSSTAYCPALSIKSYNGSWELGTYTSDILHFSYITDTNYKAGTNTQTVDIQIKTDGTIQNSSGKLKIPGGEIWIA